MHVSNGIESQCLLYRENMKIPFKDVFLFAFCFHAINVYVNSTVVPLLQHIAMASGVSFAIEINM
jgi:hypothetical protein